MKARATFTLAVLVAATVAGGAEAATKPKPKPKPKPVCNILQDVADDAFIKPLGAPVPGAPADPNADILSADLASDATNLTAVIRVKTLATDTAWPEAHIYTVQWNVPGHDAPVFLQTTIDPNPAAAAAYGPQAVFGDVVTTGSAFIGYNFSSAKVKGSVDTTANTITMSVALADIASYGTFKPGTAFSAINANTQDAINGPDTPANLPAFGGSLANGIASPDTVDAKAPYIAGTLSCVKPGS